MDFEALTKRDPDGSRARRHAAYWSPPPWGFLAFLEHLEFGRDRRPPALGFGWSRLFWVVALGVPPLLIGAAWALCVMSCHWIEVSCPSESAIAAMTVSEVEALWLELEANRYDLNMPLALCFAGASLAYLAFAAWIHVLATPIHRGRRHTV